MLQLHAYRLDHMSRFFFSQGLQILNFNFILFSFLPDEEVLFATRVIRSATNEPVSKEDINKVMSGQSVVHNIGHQDSCKQHWHVSSN